MTQQLTLDRSKTAVIIMDFHNRTVANASNPKQVVEKASQVLNGARRAEIPVIYVIHRGRGFDPNSQEAAIHSGVSPLNGEVVLAKTKTSPFSTTGLDVMLREMGRDTLVLMGVSTSGCVLSTVRWAADINYKIVVISDGCSDRDPEVHAMLMEKIYPRQGTVLTAQQFLQVLGVA